MTFQQPWAWLGLLAIAAPILAHLLARRSSVRQMFPTVRLLPPGIQNPVSRHRLTDVLPLVIRCAILAAAAAALARPVWVSADKQRALGNQLARAIIVDTGIAGAAGPQVAELSASSSVARVAEADVPVTRLGEASTWLAAQPMRREIALVSDFRAPTLSAGDLARLPSDVGIKLVSIEASKRAGAPVERRDGPLLLTSANDRAGAAAAHAAALAQGASTVLRKDRPIAVLFPGHEQHDALLKSSRDIDQPWMFDLFRAVTNDRSVRAATEEAGRTLTEVMSPRAAAINGEAHLLLVMTVPPASLVSAATIRAVAAEAAPVARVSDATVIRTAESLKALERPPAAVAPDRTQIPEDSRGRWVWLGALVLMAVEFLMTHRNAKRAGGQTRVSDVARVA